MSDLGSSKDVSMRALYERADRCIDGMQTEDWRVVMNDLVAALQRDNHRTEARLPDTIEEIRSRNQKAAERGDLSQPEFDVAWLLNYSAGEPPVEYVSKDREWKETWDTPDVEGCLQSIDGIANGSLRMDDYNIQMLATVALNEIDRLRAAQPPPAEPPYRVRAFWSPTHEYIANVCVSVDAIAIVDDNGREWEAIGSETDVTQWPTATKCEGQL